MALYESILKFSNCGVFVRFIVDPRFKRRKIGSLYGIGKLGEAGNVRIHVLLFRLGSLCIHGSLCSHCRDKE
jgi:hypothetical protein